MEEGGGRGKVAHVELEKVSFEEGPVHVEAGLTVETDER